MNHFISNVFTLLGRTVLACALLAPALPTWAEVSPFSRTPLLSAGTSVKPNLMLLLDNSGSMQEAEAPNDLSPYFVNPVTAAQAARTPSINRLMYNPDVRYEPRSNVDGTLQPAVTEVGATNTYSYNNPPRATGLDGLTTSLPGNNVTFTFYLCTSTAAGKCNAVSTFNVPPPTFSTTFVTSTYVAKSIERTDCTTYATRCSWEEERQNIRNWKRYYSTKMDATKTAIGKAFLDAKYDGKFRLGYKKMNSAASNGTSVDRGVRPFADNASLPTGYKTEKADFYTWLYAQIPNNSTPANALLKFAGDYYKDNSSNSGPWAANPIIGDDASAHLSCRRSNAVLFSDGEYSDTPAAVGNVDNGAFGSVTNTSHVNPATSVTFAYSTTPSKTATYIAYPDANANTMADLAMSYWISDLRAGSTGLNDDVVPVDGNPAYWQHMTTYTIGLGVQGNVTPEQIAKYNIDFSNGVTTATLAWGDPTASDTNKINDFIHAAYSGRGQFYSVNNASQVKDAFDDVISRTIQQAGADAGVAVSDTNNDLSTLAGELKYVPSYSLLESTGDIKAFTLSASGDVSGTVPAWYASRNIPDSSSRNLVTSSGSPPSTVGVNLTGTYASLNADIQTALGPNANNGDSFIKYLRGDTTGVNAVGQNLRIRNSRMGTVVNSPPTYVRGELEMGYTTTYVATTFTGIDLYAAYKDAKTKNSAGMLFAAANDGILHAINPQLGTEIMGFMPRSAMPKLDAFSLDPYTHDYILDGPVTEGDIYDDSTGVKAWRSMVFGTGGRGGQYVFALNVPVKTTSTGTLTSPAMTASDVKWEINKNTSTNFANLGYVLNGVQTGYLPGGKWVAVFGNGYYSSTGVASLFIVDALTGAFIQEISTGVGTSTIPNGMGGITLVRAENRQIVAAIGGDQQGNMWKFDLRTAGSGTGKVAFGGSPLYTVPGGRPFSGAPAWRPVNGGMLVVAATGLLNTKADSTDTGSQTIYGILDKTTVGGDETTTFSALGTLSDSVLLIQTTTLVAGTTTAAASYYKVSSNTMDFSTKKGWKLDLTFETGQRSVADVLNIGHTVVISTVVPPSTASTTESCTAATSVAGYVYQLDAVSGGNPDTAGFSGGRSSGFDINGDGIGDGWGVAKAQGFPRGNVIARDSIGPRTESVLTKDGNIPCDGSTTGGALLGTGTSALALVSTCGGGGYRRTWRQLINPPRIM
jgi:type IV pilus assembly protein PilY1